jgi:hypothetical protein
VLMPLAADTATIPEFSIGAELDLYFALKVNMEYRFAGNIGIYGSAGICIAAPTQVCFNLFFVYHFIDFGFPFQLDLDLGFLQCAFDVIGPLLGVDESFTNPYVYFNPGAAVSLGYQHERTFQIGLRCGVVSIIGYDNNRWRDPQPLLNVAVEYRHFLY